MSVVRPRHSDDPIQYDPAAVYAAGTVSPAAVAGLAGRLDAARAESLADLDRWRGGGAKPGFHYGATDPFGYKAVENKVHVNDLHATLLHLLGIDHQQLTYRHNGRNFRLTDVGGQVIHDLIA